MTKSRTDSKVDAGSGGGNEWRRELQKLREIILDCQLTEELKWGKPCYTFQKSNIVITIPFKESCALMFCKGVLLKDARRILAKPGENSQSGRWIKFTSVQGLPGWNPS